MNLIPQAIALGLAALAASGAVRAQTLSQSLGEAPPRAALIAPTRLDYVVETCCQLCPAVNDRSLYSSGYLEGFTTLVQGKDGWLFRSDDDLRMAFGPDEAGYAGLRRFRDALRRRGTELVMVYQPARGLMHADKLPDDVLRRYDVSQAKASYTSALQRFRSTGLIVPPFERLLQEESGKLPYFFKGDHHWTPDGARRTALLVAEAIKAAPVYRQLAQKAFVTTRTGMLAKRGTLQKAASMLCGHGYADQYVERFTTGAAEAGDLFGEDKPPEVALVGTSNSDPAYNFAGFISEALGVEVLNESITGGGFDGPLFRYLPSEAFQKTPPKVLIWELETYHNLADRDFYRRVIPMIDNGCQQKPAVLTKSAKLKGASTEVLFNGGGAVRDLTGRNYLLDVQFDDPRVEKLKAVVWYADGGKDNLSLENSPRIEAKGRFVTELRSDAGWGERTFLSLDLLLPDDTPPGVGVKATLCSRDAPPARPRLVSASR